jgi:hypothetical protein
LTGPFQAVQKVLSIATFERDCFAGIATTHDIIDSSGIFDA